MRDYRSYIDLDMPIKLTTCMPTVAVRFSNTQAKYKSEIKYTKNILQLKYQYSLMQLHFQLASN